MKSFLLLTALLLVVPMSILNPFGQPAFIGYYAGVIATWIAYVAALHRGAASVGHGSRTR